MSNPWPVYSHGTVAADDSSAPGYNQSRPPPPAGPPRGSSRKVPVNMAFNGPNRGPASPSMRSGHSIPPPTSRYNMRPSPSQQSLRSSSSQQSLRQPPMPPPPVRSSSRQDPNASPISSHSVEDEQWPLPPRAIIQDGRGSRPGSPKRLPPRQQRPDMVPGSPRSPRSAGQPRQSRRTPPPQQQQYYYPPVPRPHRGNGQRRNDGYRSPRRQQSPVQSHQLSAYQYYPESGSNSYQGYAEHGPRPRRQYPQRPPPGPPTTARRGMPIHQHQKPAQVHSIAEEGDSVRGSMLSVGIPGNLARSSYASSNAILGYYTEERDEAGSSPYGVDSPVDTVSGTGDEEFFTPPVDQDERKQNLFEQEASTVTLQPQKFSTALDRDVQDSSPEPQMLIRQASLGKKSRPTLTTVTRKDSVTRNNAPVDDEALAPRPPMSYFEDETPDTPAEQRRGFFDEPSTTQTSHVSQLHGEVSEEEGLPSDDSTPEFNLHVEDDEPLNRPSQTHPTFAFDLRDESQYDTLNNENANNGWGSRVSSQRFNAGELGEIGGAAALATALRKDFIESNGGDSARSSANVEVLRSRATVVPRSSYGFQNQMASDINEHTENNVINTRVSTSLAVPTSQIEEPADEEVIVSEKQIKRMPSRELLNAAVPKEQQRRSRPRSPLAPTAIDPTVERLVSDLEKDGAISPQEAETWRNPGLTTTYSGANEQQQQQMQEHSRSATPTIAAIAAGAIAGSVASPRGSAVILQGPEQGSDTATRGSLTSLSDLIRRATKVANNLDRGRTASRLGMNWFLDPANNSNASLNEKNEKYLSNAPNVRRSGVSFSDILSSFPDPNSASQGGENGFSRADQVRNSQLLASDSDDGEAAAARRRTQKRRCCGMPRWAFILVALLVFLLVCAAVLVPVLLVYLPQLQRTQQPQPHH